MSKLLYFIMVGLFFTTFQVSEVEAQRGDPRDGDTRVDTRDPRSGGGDVRDSRSGGGDVRDPRSGGGDVRDPRSGGGDVRDPRVREEVETRGLSKREMVQECKKKYGKKRKNKAAKQACIAAARGQ
jgi:hypothetical protein